MALTLKQKSTGRTWTGGAQSGKGDKKRRGGSSAPKTAGSEKKMEPVNPGGTTVTSPGGSLSLRQLPTVSSAQSRTGTGGGAAPDAPGTGGSSRQAGEGGTAPGGSLSLRRPGAGDTVTSPGGTLSLRQLPAAVSASAPETESGGRKLTLHDSKKAERGSLDSRGPVPYSPLTSLMSTGRKGLNAIAQAGGDTLAMGEDLVLAPFELFSGLQLGALSDSAPLNTWAAKIREEADATNQRYQANMERGGKIAQTAENLGAATIAAMPNAVLALLTGGASVAPSTAKLASAASAQLSPSVSASISRAVNTMARNPQYWASFGHVVGTGYETAIQDQREMEAAKAAAAAQNGLPYEPEDETMLRTKAALYAVGNGLLNAAVEISGGVETLPGELQGGASAWRAFVDSMVSEGMEEVVQGVIERALKNPIYSAENPLFSATDPRAILNPRSAMEEFGGGFVVGGLLGGGQIGLGLAADANNTRRVGRELNSAGFSQADVQAFIDEGIASAPDTDAHRLALKAQEKISQGKTLGDYEFGRLYQANIEAVNQEQLAKTAQKDAQTPQESPQVVQDTQSPTRTDTTPEGPQRARETLSGEPDALPSLGRADQGALRQGAAESRTDGAGALRLLREAAPQLARADLVTENDSRTGQGPGLVLRPGFGEIEVKSPGRQLDGPESALLSAVPGILQNGEQIALLENGESAMFASPIQIDGETLYGAAMVRRTGEGRFALYEVLDSNGNVIDLDSAEISGLDQEAPARGPLSLEALDTDTQSESRPGTIREDTDTEKINQAPRDVRPGERTEGVLQNEQRPRLDTAPETGEAGSAQNGTKILDGEQVRGPGQRAGEQGRSVARRAEPDPAALEQRRTALERQASAKTLRREKVSSRDLGLENGTDAKTLDLVPLDDWDDAMFSNAEKVWDESGIEVSYVLGSIEIQEPGGTTAKVRGVYEPGKRIILQADNMTCSIEQLAKHELFHDKAYQSPGLVRQIEDKIMERYDAREFNQVADAYIEQLRGLTEISEASSEAEIEAAYLSVLEEIYADAYAGINAFDADASKFIGEVREVLEDRGLTGTQQETLTESETSLEPTQERQAEAREETQAEPQPKKTRYSMDEDQETQETQKPRKPKTPKSRQEKTRPAIAQRELRRTLLDTFSIPQGSRSEISSVIDGIAEDILRSGALTAKAREAAFDRLYNAGVMTVAADEYLQTGRQAVRGGRVYVDESIRAEFGDDWNAFRRQAFAAGIYLTSSRADGGVDVWTQELGETLPGLFDAHETDGRAALERIVQVAQEGKDQRLSLPEYVKELSGKRGVREWEVLRDLEQQLDWALRTFAEKADLEVRLREQSQKQLSQTQWEKRLAQERERGEKRLAQERERSEKQLAQERERAKENGLLQRAKEALRRSKERQRRVEMVQRQRENRQLRDLQQKTLKQLQWLSKNAWRTPKDLRARVDDLIGNIDIFAASAANEMNWSGKYNATWKDIAQMYQEAKKSDPNFLPSKDLERIVKRLDGDKIADMDLSALQDLYKAAVGLRTEFYNRNNVILDEKGRAFNEIYQEVKKEFASSKAGYKGGALDKFVNLEQMTPMNVLERMGGWNPDGTFYSMAKQLEQGERDMRAYTVEAKRHLESFLTENEDWVKRADGQGKDAIWYELEVPELIKLGMGDKPLFGDTVKVYMTPAQKVHLYLESKSTENLRHMTGGRTFVNKDLYSQGKRTEALAQGTTVKLAPETVKKIVSDLTAEELALAGALESYYNVYAKGKINKVSNTLYGYDKAISNNYAPIYTNQNYTKSEIGIYDATAEGVGHLKSREYAVNPSYNISALDAFERHIDQTSRFVGMSIPARNWQTLLNWREKDNSMGDILTHQYGQEGKQYIEDLLTELQAGAGRSRSGVESLMNTTLSNYISSVFGFNPSIVFKQAMSFPLAATYLGWGNLPNIQKALATDDQLINTYTSELAYRLMGYATPETAALKNNPSKLSQNRALRFTFGGGAITAMDGWTVKSMWRWAENAVRKENPDLEAGSQALIESGQSPFYQEVARRFEEAVSRSQPMYDVMHRSKIMRSDNGAVRALTLFKTVPQQQYNMLRQSIAEAGHYKKAWQEGRAGKDDYRAAQKRTGRAVLGILMAGLGIEAINFLNAMLKNGGKRYKDEDEDKITWESAGKTFLQGFASDNLGMVIGGDLVSQVLGSAVTGDKWYGIETPGVSQIQSVLEEFLDGCGELQKLVREGYDVAQNGGDVKEYLRRNGPDYLGALENALGTVATYFGGVAYNNVKTYTLGALRWLAPEVETAYQDAIKTADKSGLDGLTGDALETRVADILKNRLGSASDYAAETLAGLYEAGFKAAVPGDTPKRVSAGGSEEELSPFQQQRFDLVWRENVEGNLDDLISSHSFQSAGAEGQEHMLKGLYDYASELAKKAALDSYQLSSAAEKAQEVLESGRSIPEYLELKENGAVDRYLKALDNGSAAPEAGEAALAVSQAKENAGENPDKLTLYREALTAAGGQEAQMAALSLLMSPGEFARVSTGLSCGVSPELYLSAREAVTAIDDNGSISQDEAASAIAMLPGLSDQERAVLWQLQNKSWKPGKNPFSSSVGARVYQAMQSDGSSLPAPEPKEAPTLELPKLS